MTVIRNVLLSLGLGLLLLGAVSACSSSKNKNPVASSEEMGKVAEVEAKPDAYTAMEGDTLRKIAGRPEIYGDPNLWPLIQEANAETVGSGMAISPGTQLRIPRDSSSEQLDEAREKSRQYAAAIKMTQSKRLQQSEPKAKPEIARDKGATLTPVSAQPVPPAKKGRILFPVLLVLLLILAGLAALLFYFMKKDRKEENPQ